MKFKVTRKDQDVIASVMVFKEKWWLWVISIKNLIRYGIPAALLILALFSYSMFHKPQHQQDYFKAAQVFEKWETGDESKLNELENLMRKHPELHGKYDAAIAGHLIAKEQGNHARGFATNALKRTQSVAPTLSSFAKTSLKISEGHYQEALIDSKALHAKIDKDQDHVLYAYNLMRMASLGGELEDHATESQALKDLQAFLQEHEGDPELSLLTQHFDAGSVHLDDYIAERTQGY